MGDGGIVGRKLNTADWVGIVVCVVIGTSVTDAVGRQVDPQMDFWPAFGVKVATGGAVAVALIAVWLGVIRRRA
jgi:uncharacterized membrane-anchored protein